MKNFRLIIIKIDKNKGYFNMTMDWTLSSVLWLVSNYFTNNVNSLGISFYVYIISCKYKAINCLSEQNSRL